MAAIRYLLLGVGFLVSLCLIDADVILKPLNNMEVVISDSENGLLLNVTVDTNVTTHIGKLGLNTTGNYTITSSSNLAIFTFQRVQLRVTANVFDSKVVIRVLWTSTLAQRYVDCMDLGDVNWFGGPQQKRQLWPVNKLKFNEYSYVTKEEDNCAIAEPYWVSAAGTVLYVNKIVPLFIDQENIEESHLCFISENKDPYSTKRSSNILSYDIVLTANAREGHEYAVRNYLGKPDDVPDFRMVQHPIWSTWARYFRPINESIVMNMAVEILDNNFKNSQFEIDDLWEVCYGSLTVDKRKFPDMKKTVQHLKELGFRVTLWIHPFINENCDPWFTEAKNNSYLVKTENGSIYTNWWNQNNTRASYIDFTNPRAANWWINRVLDLKNEYEFDSFKFDAGESGWSPQIAIQTGDIDEQPAHNVIDYVRLVALLGPMIEVRSGQRTQDLPVFVRMVDKDTLWSFDNGLPTLVTTLLQMNMAGYTMVLPDMIGGNGYNERPSKELFIRWLQANVFMPSLQYSFVPWDYDSETIAICHTFTDLHAQYAEQIYYVMKQSAETGRPVNAPIWWNDPYDKIAQGIDDEFLLGSSILVAPVMKQGNVTRDIYLPAGLWTYREDDRIFYVGNNWYRDFPAPLDTLPYFKLIGTSAATAKSMRVMLFVTAVVSILFR